MDSLSRNVIGQIKNFNVKDENNVVMRQLAMETFTSKWKQIYESYMKSKCTETASPENTQLNLG